jgi:hypothetical protein
MLNFTLAEVTPGDPVWTSPVRTSVVLTDTVLTDTVLTDTVVSTVAELRAPQAATRPLAGFGAGAFACDGARVGSAAKQLTAGPALPRIRGTFAAVRPAHAGAADASGRAFRGSTIGGSTIGGSTIGGSNVGTGMAGTRNGGTKQLNQTTRIYPVAPGGLGPHPAREPDPV